MVIIEVGSVPCFAVANGIFLPDDVEVLGREQGLEIVERFNMVENGFDDLSIKTRFDAFERNACFVGDLDQTCFWQMAKPMIRSWVFCDVIVHIDLRSSLIMSVFFMVAKLLHPARLIAKKIELCHGRFNFFYGLF